MKESDKRSESESDESRPQTAEDASSAEAPTPPATPTRRFYANLTDV